MSDDGSVFSRFLIKFVEIVAAGLATAVSGYLLAHLTGALSSPVPVPAQPVVQAAPNATAPAEPPSANSGDLSEQHAATKEVVSPPQQPVRPASTAKIALPRKHTEAAPSAAENKRDQESLAARVRDALANVDANRTSHPAMPAHGDGGLNLGGPASQPQSSPDTSRRAVTVAAPPSTGEVKTVPPQPSQPDPLITVEIPSRPVATVQPSPTPPAETETGIVSTLEHMLRHDPLAGSEEAPRPPMPVGQ
jgi:hypothetical protein